MQEILGLIEIDTGPGVPNGCTIVDIDVVSACYIDTNTICADTCCAVHAAARISTYGSVKEYQIPWINI